MSEKLPKDKWILLIGVTKMIKCVALVSIAILALTLVKKDVALELRHWAFVLGINPGGHLVQSLLGKASALDAHQLRLISAVLFAYAGLFALEGTGLLLRRRWGEWVTVGITGSFIPIEVYETVRHPHVPRAITIVLNVLAVAYLVHRLRAGRKEKREKKEQEGVSGRTSASSAPPLPRTDSQLRTHLAGTGSAASATSRRA